MKNLLALSVALLSSIGFGGETRYLLLPDFTPTLTREMQPQELLFTDGGVSVVQVDAARVEELVIKIHAELGGCGGFIDVTPEIEEGQTPTGLVWRELRKKDVVTEFRWTESIGTRDGVADLVKGADGEKLFAFLTELTAFPDRSATTANGGKAAEFLQTRAASFASALPGLRTWTVATDTMTYNKQPSVVATLPGLDPALPHVVIGAHMDTFSNGMPGADDDGSGSAVVMEALRVIASQHASFQHTIDFIWYAAEERGLVGSSFVVKRFKKDAIPVMAVLQMDMVGYNSENEQDDVYLITDNTDETLNRTLKTIISTYVTTKIGETECGYACSDHANWDREGIPAVFPFEASFENHNQKLHTQQDKMQFLDREHSTRFAQISLAFLGEIAKLTHKP